MWPESKDAELREDIQVLIKFWQAMHSDKKYIKHFMVAGHVEGSQLLQHNSPNASQYTSGSSSIGPYLQVGFKGLPQAPLRFYLFSLRLFVFLFFFVVVFLQRIARKLTFKKKMRYF